MDREAVRHRPAAGDLERSHGAVDGFPYQSAAALWEGIQSNWIELITGWNQNGVRWRELSGAEILWMVHLNTIENLKNEKPAQVRMYLTSLKDYTALREWDNARMKDSSDK